MINYLKFCFFFLCVCEVSVERSEKNVFIRCTIGMHNVVSIDKKLEYVSVIVSVFLKIYLLYNFTEGTKFSLKKEALEKKTMFRKEKTRGCVKK